MRKKLMRSSILRELHRSHILVRSSKNNSKLHRSDILVEAMGIIIVQKLRRSDMLVAAKN